MSIEGVDFDISQQRVDLIDLFAHSPDPVFTACTLLFSYLTYNVRPIKKIKKRLAYPTNSCIIPPDEQENTKHL